MDATTTSTPASPDADLIRTCAEHIVNLHAYNAPGGPDLEPADNPLWAAYGATRDVICDARPQTLAGMAAIARAAIAEAGKKRKAEDRTFHSIEEELSWNLVHDMLRLHGDVVS